MGGQLDLIWNGMGDPSVSLPPAAPALPLQPPQSLGPLVVVPGASHSGGMIRRLIMALSWALVTCKTHPLLGDFALTRPVSTLWIRAFNKGEFLCP